MRRQKKGSHPIADVPADVHPKRQEKQSAVPEEAGMNAVPERAAVSAASRFLAPAVKTAMPCWKA